MTVDVRIQGRPPATKTRECIQKLHEAGISQADIGRQLVLTEGGVRYHLRTLGIGPRAPGAFPGHKPRGDLKRCAICDEDKPLSEFRNPRHVSCAMCRRHEGFDRS